MDKGVGRMSTIISMLIGGTIVLVGLYLGGKI